MKRFFYPILLLFVTVSASAQWMADSVLMGPSSGNDVYYSLKNGTIKTENNKNWHLAFSMSPADSAGIWANHNAGNSFVKVYNIHKTFADWASVTIADTAGAQPCYNMDKGWHQGALNDLPRPSVFSFGWGTYNMTTHNVTGDSMFIIQADSQFYKVYIHSLASIPMDYIISVENLNGGTAVMDTISKGTTYTNRNFAFYNLATMSDLDREPDNTSWDLLFNRYNTLATQGGITIPYSVVGALSNKMVKSVAVGAVHVDTTFANYGTYISPWPANSNVISNVGYEWKLPPAGPPPATWVIPDSLSYLIQDRTGNLYQLQFTGYSGTGSGRIYLRKRMVVPTLVNDVQSAISRYEVFPNPAQGNIYLTVDSKENTAAKLQLISISGQVVYQSVVNLQSGINSLNLSTAQFANGAYVLCLDGVRVQLRENIIVRH
jgi:hypothetical protein